MHRFPTSAMLTVLSDGEVFRCVHQCRKMQFLLAGAAEGGSSLPSSLDLISFQSQHQRDHNDSMLCLRKVRDEYVILGSQTLNAQNIFV